MNREQIIANAVALLESQSTNEDRKAILEAITENICERCGALLNGRTCHCDPAYDE